MGQMSKTFQSGSSRISGHVHPICHKTASHSISRHNPRVPRSQQGLLVARAARAVSPLPGNDALHKLCGFTLALVGTACHVGSLLVLLAAVVLGGRRVFRSKAAQHVCRPGAADVLVGEPGLPLCTNQLALDAVDDAHGDEEVITVSAKALPVTVEATRRHHGCSRATTTSTHRGRRK